MQRAFQVTLTVAGTVYNLYTLISAVAGAIPTDGILPKSVRELVIESDPVAAIVKIGDANISATNYGHQLSANEVFQVRASNNTIHVPSYFVLSDTASKEINVLLEFM